MSLKSCADITLTSVTSTVRMCTPQPVTTSFISLMMASRSSYLFLMMWSIVELAIWLRTIALVIY